MSDLSTYEGVLETFGAAEYVYLTREYLELLKKQAAVEQRRIQAQLDNKAKNRSLQNVMSIRHKADAISQASIVAITGLALHDRITRMFGEPTVISNILMECILHRSYSHPTDVAYSGVAKAVVLKRLTVDGVKIIERQVADIQRSLDKSDGKITNAYEQVFFHDVLMLTYQQLP